MIRLKTAVLLGFSLELGALLAGAEDTDRQALRDFGVNIGIGFQLRDDLLDVYADKKEFGKQVGGDIIANKKTFLLIKALEKARGNDAQVLKHWLAAKKFDKRKKVKAVTQLYNKLGIRELAEHKADEFFSKGFSLLKTLKNNERTDGLIEFTQRLEARQK
jgi:geranylgeranyl diphosphate synthase type II